MTRARLTLLLFGLVLLLLPSTTPHPASAGSAPSLLVPTTMPMNACSGFPASLTASATEVSVQLPSDVPNAAASLQAWGSPSAVLLGPGDVRCVAGFGSADGGLILSLVGADDPCSPQLNADCDGSTPLSAESPPTTPPPPVYSGYHRPNADTDRITAVFSPGGAGPHFDLACPYFPSLQAQPLAAERFCLLPLPPGQAVQQVDDNSVAFYQPADATHPNPTFGLVVVQGMEATCTLPASVSDLCKAILIAFLTGGYNGLYEPATGTGAMALDPLAGTGAMALDSLPWFTPQPARDHFTIGTKSYAKRYRSSESAHRRSQRSSLWLRVGKTGVFAGSRLR